MQEIKLGKYRHFKGMIVEVIGVALHSETMEEMVVYRHDDPVKGKDAGTLWVRPLGMFLETVEKDGQKIPRFEYVEVDQAVFYPIAW
ncbi:MAG TPA: hypothetical protein DCX32_00550, partial [Candidatus Moranbacteria bacterium]|nr:hypothetical protein [Candidatus Moranbacteria bacterium]